MTRRIDPIPDGYGTATDLIEQTGEALTENTVLRWLRQSDVPQRDVRYQNGRVGKAFHVKRALLLLRRKIEVGRKRAALVQFHVDACQRCGIFVDVRTSGYCGECEERRQYESGCI